MACFGDLVAVEIRKFVEISGYSPSGRRNTKKVRRRGAKEGKGKGKGKERERKGEGEGRKGKMWVFFFVFCLFY